MFQNHFKNNIINTALVGTIVVSRLIDIKTVSDCHVNKLFLLVSDSFDLKILFSTLQPIIY